METAKAGAERADGKNSERAGPRASPGRAAEGAPNPNASKLLLALTALKKGDFTVRLPLDWAGIDGKIADAFNEIVELNQHANEELRRIRRVVGEDGKISQRISMGDVRGGWASSIDSVNALIGDLVHPTSETARVIGAVARGDLSQVMSLDIEGRPLRGEFLRTAKTVNLMVGQLAKFASEVTRVAREVGTEGKLGGQARVTALAGTWKNLTDNVNVMAGNLTSQVRNIAEVATAIASGDLSKKITVDVRGEILDLKNTINTMVDQLSSFASEVTRVAREVGTEGKLGGQAVVPGVAGTWKDLTDNVNSMAGNLTSQVRNIAAVTTAVANGDLTKKITVDVQGEILELKNTINTMVGQLSSFASEVTRVAREVGTEGNLGGQANVKGVAGTWKDLTDNVNSMAGNLTSQVRNIAAVTTAVANGDLSKKISVDVQGEILELKNTINTMVDQLSSFASEVTRVAREVGTEGKLGGQAEVRGVSGTWKDLTDNVNQLAANLTTQVRAIADVATAVTKGDLTRSIQVQAEGEVASLKDNINEMIRNLKDTTLKNAEQDWLKTNLAKFSRMLQGQKDLLTVGRLILSELAPVVTAQYAAFYTLESGREDVSDGQPRLRFLAGYAYTGDRNTSFRLGEGLVGQCAVERQKIILKSVPRNYVRITSGLGEAPAQNVMVLPVVFEGTVKAVLELASFDQFNPMHEVFLDQLMESIGIVFNTIEANMRTEDLLKQSQSLANELQSQQEELKLTNQELEEKATLLAERNVEVERKNEEVEHARCALEDKAEQLALTSKYKSEFLANMSHELRTPLNSLLILSDQLVRNQEGNLTGRQVDYARTIQESGKDLLALINDILDLSKIESGTVTLDIGELSFRELRDYVERTFRHVADAKGLEFSVRVEDGIPAAFTTDAKRLQQVLKNLLSNAFKFTERGSVEVRVGVATGGWSEDIETLSRARSVFALSVTDTGIGIPADKQQIIFEAFQQADGSTSRRYGGTGLGLAISRELSKVLGGMIRLESVPRVGSTFTLYLPSTYFPVKAARRADRILVEGPAEESEPAAVATETLPELPPVLLRDVVEDDRATLRPGEPTLLIVDNDTAFAKFFLDLAHERGFKAVVTGHGTAALSLAEEYAPTAICLDIRLPDMDGWRVLSHLKGSFETRHVPVVVISTDDEPERGRRGGAAEVMSKPVTREQLERLLDRIREDSKRPARRLLLIEDDSLQRDALAEWLESDTVEVRAAASGGEALELLSKEAFDCIVSDLGLPDVSGIALLEQIRGNPGASRTPIVVYTARDLTEAETAHIRRLAESVVVKDFRSRDQLLDETTLRLHRPVGTLTGAQQDVLRQLHDPRVALKGRRALVVDDDIRNIFAMTSILERYDMTVLSAETGNAAIATLKENPDVDVVLMDIMMPGMDGHDTMKAIRRIDRFRRLPIIAVTAKAMKGDREKCIESGASDYIAKPVDSRQLLSMLRQWLHR